MNKPITCHAIKVIKTILAIAVIFFAPPTVTANNSAMSSLADVPDLINNSEQGSLAAALSSILCNFEIKTVYITHYHKIKTNVINLAIGRSMQCDSLPAVVILYYVNTQPFIRISDDYSAKFIVRIKASPHPYPSSNVIRPRASDRYRTYVMFVYTDPQDDTEEWLKPLLYGYAREYLLYNVVVMFQWYNGTIQLSTYSPYTDEVLTFTNDTYRLEKLFYDKTKNFHRKPLKVSIFPDEVRAIADANGHIKQGVDFEFSKMLARTLNATLALYEPLDGEDYGDPISATDGTGSLGQVMREEVDIAANSRFLRLDWYRNGSTIAEPTTQTGRDDLCVLVPSPSYRSIFKNLIYALDMWSWVFILATSIPFTFLIRYIAAVSVRDGETGRNEERFVEFSYFDTIRCYFSQSLLRLPQTATLRLTILSWLLFTFVVTSAFQCCFRSAFTAKIWDEIDTIKDLAESEFPIATHSNFHTIIQLYFVHAPKVSPINRQRIINKLTVMKCTAFLEHLSNNNTAIAYAEKWHLTSHYANSKDFNGDPLFKAMPNCLVPFLSCYILPYGTPLLGQVNNIIDRFFEGGLFRYWQRRAKTRRYQFTRNAYFTHPLQLEHLGFVFYILLTGYFIAFVAFIWEVYDKKAKSFGRQMR